jgi:hypothetical protein
VKFPDFKAHHFFDLGCYLHRDNMFVLEVERQANQCAELSDQIQFELVRQLLFLTNQNIK